MNEISITEIYGPVIQGEGALCGQVSHFIRTAGCSYKCSWCDSMHSVDPIQIKHNATKMSEEEIAASLMYLGQNRKNIWVTLTGGDPCIWNLNDLCIGLKRLGFLINVETQGHIFANWLAKCDLVTCSPKGPSSGMDNKVNFETLRLYQNEIEHLIFKIVIFGVRDLEFAEQVTSLFPKIPLYLTSGTSQAYSDPSAEANAPAVLGAYRWLTEAVLARPALHHAIISPQMHVLAYGHARGR